MTTVGVPGDHPVGVAAVNRFARVRHERSFGAFAPAGLENPENRHGQWHGGGLVAHADQVQHPVAAKRLGVVLDPDGGRLGGAQRVDAEQVRQGAMVNADGLGDLEESDQLEPVQAMGPGLVAVDLGKACVDGWVRQDEAVDVGEPEVPRTDSPRNRMWSSMCARWIPISGSRWLVSHQANQRRSW